MSTQEASGIPPYKLKIDLDQSQPSSQLLTNNHPNFSTSQPHTNTRHPFTTQKASTKSPSTYFITSVSNLCKVALVDVKASTIINTPVDMANPKCSCHCGCNNVVIFSGGNLCEPCNDNHNQ
ncbi:uncharacterized protein FPRO_11961 [Fusarium proliferatum ET1]|uniref:Uncharacterized protein n=2 Tax=Gibberella intermedia TaxID=948311 RepID=A0A1L7W229_FUSPR|nr:uncharacterized protein FPRO_11961 [Fusarium proliferatum ET1]RBA13954.1 hypothetical protein FPRO05_02746 [Fusarium proliferatum]CZR46512.1 uncharacterized protein FPRO_11961 [Fusarium proliferatum ET1]